MALITKETPVGQEFSGKPKKVTWERVWAFSGGPFTASGWPKKNIHTDIEFAKNAGLPTACASGTQYQGYVIQLLLDLFGEEWLKNGKMTAKFIKLVPVGDTLQAKAKIQFKEEVDSKVKYILDIWCQNQNGDKVLVGTAVGLVR